MDENKIRQIIREEIASRSNATRFGVNNVPFHTHNGTDSPKVSSEDIIPGVSVSGRITFAREATYILNLNSRFTPRHIQLYGVAYSTRVTYTFTSSSTINATTGSVYTVGGANYTVLNTVSGSLTVEMYGSVEPPTSGTLTLVVGSGNTSIVYTSYYSSTPPATRAIIVGSANLGASFYFQPSSDSSVVTGNIEYPFVDPNLNDGTVVPLQSSMYFLATNGSTTFRGQPGEGHIVDVQFSGTIYARMTVTEFSRNKVVLVVSFLESGWEIYTNIVIT